MDNDRERLKQEMQLSFEAKLENRLDRASRTKIHGIIPFHYFSVASSECRNMFLDAYFYGCISVAQAMAEAISKFICRVHSVRTGKALENRIARLEEKKLISSQAADAFRKIHGNDRNTFHHLKEDVETDCQSHWSGRPTRQAFFGFFSIVAGGPPLTGGVRLLCSQNASWLVKISSGSAEQIVYNSKGALSAPYEPERKPMNTRQPRYSKEEHAQRGDDIYERHVRPHVEAGNLGKIVAIDVDTGAFEVAEDTLTASQRLLTRYPDAQIWCIRIGHRGVHRFGWYPRVTGER